MIRSQFIFILFTFVFFSAHAELVDKVVAIVNDDIVTHSDVLEFQKKLKANGLLDETLLALYDRKSMTTTAATAIQFLIDERTIDSEIRKLGIVSPIEQVESEIRNIAKSKGLDRNQLKMALKNEGVAYSDYQDFVKSSLQRQNLVQREVYSKIKISDDDISSFYVANYSSAKALVFEYSLSHIVFLNSNGGADGALKRAQNVAKKIEQGIPFETLAAQNSEDPQFVQGGHFGTFKIADFNSEIQSALTPLNANETSRVVKVPDGYRIFKVTKKTLVASSDLESKREDIRRKLVADNFRRQFRLWLDQKRQDSYIRIN